MEEIKKKYYTLEQVCEIMQVSKMTMYRWIKDKKIKCVKIGKSYRFSVDDINEFLYH